MADIPIHPVLVSVLINNYNYGRFLAQAIDSVLAQDYPHIELVVVDDGSTDDSLPIIAGYGSRIVPVLKPNGGQASAYNAGFAASTGEILCLLDADDLFAPGKITSIVRIFGENPEIGWCFDRVHEFHDDIAVRRAPLQASSYGKWEVREATASGKPPLVPTASSGFSFRRETLDRILPMPETMRIAGGSGADKYLTWTSMALVPGWCTPGELTYQRVHGSNAYTGRSEGKKRLSGQLEMRTAISMYERFPVLERLSVKIFARGFGKLVVNGELNADDRRSIRSFLRALSLPSRLDVSLRVVAWTLAERVAKMNSSHEILEPSAAPR